MGKDQHELDNLKGQNPFRVPKGYMESLTDQIMSQLPEDATCEKKSRKVPMITRLRPWIGIAAISLGIAFFINIFIGLEDQTDAYMNDSLRVQTQRQADIMSGLQSNLDEEYLEYLEARYSDYILEEELAYSE